jgi:hypothetical protein
MIPLLLSVIFFLILFIVIDFIYKYKNKTNQLPNTEPKREFGTITIEKNKDTIIDDSIIKEIPELNNNDDVLIEE